MFKLHNNFLNIIEQIRLNLSKNSFQSSEAIAIFGSPRSGSTWLMELLSNLPRYISIFEPLHKEWFPESQKYGFSPRTFLHPDDKQKEKRKYFEEIFEGKIVSKNPHFRLKNVFSRFYGDKILAKFIRGNRLLPYMVENFDLKGYILLVRHPCATIESQLRTGIRSYHLSKDSKINIDLIFPGAKKIIPKDSQKILKSVDTQEELLAIIWALDYYIPLYFKKKYDFTLISYERLVIDPEFEIKKVLKEFGYEEYLSKIMKQIKTPSMTTAELKDSKQKQLGKWKNRLSENEIENILSIVHSFGLDFYTKDLEPNYERLNDWSSETSNESLEEVFDTN